MGNRHIRRLVAAAGRMLYYCYILAVGSLMVEAEHIPGHMHQEEAGEN